MWGSLRLAPINTTVLLLGVVILMPHSFHLHPPTALRDIAIDSPTSQITLSLPDTPPTITLNCSVVAHSIPRLEWTRNGQPVVGQQAATDFMEAPFSLLTVNTSDLVNGVETFNCTATLDLSGADRNSCMDFDGSISASVNITAYCKYSHLTSFHRQVCCLHY